MIKYNVQNSKRSSFFLKRRLPWVDIVEFLLLISILTWLMVRSAGKMGYNWQWYRISSFLFQLEDGKLIIGPLIEGLMVTFKITVWSIVLTFSLGLITALFRMSDSFIAKTIARLYLELIRNTRLLVQLFFFYFVIGPVIGISRFLSVVLALSFFEGAYASEIFRAGIVSIDKGQWEAAHSLGLTTFQMYQHIILPQAIRIMLPPLTSQGISLIKDSALASTVAIYDLTMEAKVIISDTFLTFEIWFTIAGIYFIINFSLSILVNYLEFHFKIKEQ